MGNLLRSLSQDNERAARRLAESDDALRANVEHLKKQGVEFDNEFDDPHRLWPKIVGQRWKKMPEGLPNKVFNLWINDTEITSLEGCPRHVENTFVMRGNRNLESLKGCPASGTGSYLLHENALTSLEGCPRHVGNDFACHFNQLTSLKGAPLTVNGRVRLFGNRGIKSLEGIGSDYFAEVKELIISGISLQSHALGLLLVKGSIEIPESMFKSKDANVEGLKIIKRYLDEGGGQERVIDCQHELIDAGFEAMAQL